MISAQLTMPKIGRILGMLGEKFVDDSSHCYRYSKFQEELKDVLTT